MRAHEIRYFFYIGGNDSADTCRIIDEQARENRYQLRIVHVPKTIDNDLVGTDHCPGYGSAAKFVAQAISGANLDNRALPGVYIAVIMGRHAGFLTAASAFARKFPDDGPHLVYLPERVFDPERFVGDVDATYKKYGRCVVAVSEGVCGRDGQPIAASLAGPNVERDAHGNVQLSGGALGDVLGALVKQKTGIRRVRPDTLGYLQRSYLGCVSETDAHEAREVGEKAVQFSVWHDVDGSVAIKRVGDYAVEYELLKLTDVAARTKVMPDEFINADANGVTDAFKAYARPLVGDLATVDRIAAPMVQKLGRLDWDDAPETASSGSARGGSRLA
jgi:6-phosphofructokinase 1